MMRKEVTRLQRKLITGDLFDVVGLEVLVDNGGVLGEVFLVLSELPVEGVEALKDQMTVAS